MSDLVMYDSIDAADLPPGADAYAGYNDGNWPDWLAEVARFPGTHILSITVFPGVVADACDCENGDLTIAQVPPWVRWRLDAGAWRPVVYCGAANSQPVLGVLAMAGISRSEIRLWSAHYGAGRHICGPGTCGYPQADGTQWADNAPGVNGAWVDESLLTAGFFGTPPKPPQPVSLPAAARSGDEMFYLPNGAGAVVSVPIPVAVLKASGIIAPPTEIRFGTNAACEVATNVDKGGWVTFPIDGNRSPNVVSLPAGAQEVEVQRVDAGKNLVTADFA